MMRFGLNTSSEQRKLFNPGIVLKPGEYRLRFANYIENPDIYSYVAMIGYWARP